MKTTICESCRGNGNPRCVCRAEPCDTCDGEGVRDCDMGHEHECDDCDGSGKTTKCEERGCVHGWIPDGPGVPEDRERKTCDVCNGVCVECSGRGVVRK